MDYQGIGRAGIVENFPAGEKECGNYPLVTPLAIPRKAKVVHRIPTGFYCKMVLK